MIAGIIIGVCGTLTVLAAGGLVLFCIAVKTAEPEPDDTEHNGLDKPAS